MLSKFTLRRMYEVLHGIPGRAVHVYKKTVPKYGARGEGDSGGGERGHSQPSIGTQ